MVGLAQALFYQRSPAFRFNPIARRAKICSCPLLDKLVACGYLGSIDLALAEQLLQSSGQPDEASMAFLSYLARSARDGHLCLKISGERIEPDPGLLLNPAVAEGEISPKASLTPADIESFSSLILEGSRTLPSTLFAKVADIDPLPALSLCYYEGAGSKLFYLQRNWIYESEVIAQTLRVAASQPAIALDRSNVEARLAALKLEGKLLSEQAEAILQASLRPLTLISGGPGTGKTYTAGQLIRIIWESLTSQQQSSFTILLAAPTGKAAANLQKSLRASVPEAVASRIALAKTLHALLGLRKSNGYGSQARGSLQADLIVVDECSMIDVRLMARLFSAVKGGARLVLLGDKDQLPAVEAGSLFGDLVAAGRKGGKLFACTLNRSLRTEQQEILDLAAAIRDGDVNQALQRLSDTQGQGCVRRRALGENVLAEHKAILELASRYFVPAGELLAPADLLASFNHFRLLSPLRKGPFGVETLNQLIAEHLLKKNRRGAPFFAPIMIASNDHQLGLFNGEIGLLVKEQGSEMALFPNKEGEGVRKLSVFLLPAYEYAYCLSVHKSQGSEFEKVLLVLPEGSEIFGREALYTAVTRAKKEIEVWAAAEVLKATISRQSQRLSGLYQRLELGSERN